MTGARDTIRLGVIGIGNMGSEHCRNLVAGKCTEVRLTAVADLREERRAWARQALPEGTAVFETGSELILSGLCDAVLIAVPHYGHEALAEEALKAGLDVLCEKPAAVEADAAERMIRTAEETGKTLALMFNQRTNGLYRRVKAELESGRLGEIKRVCWIVTDWYRTQRYYDSGSWRATWAGEGGGVLLNQCPHQLDLLIWLCGMPVRTQAHCHEGKWHDIEVEDDVTAYLEFANGATGVFIASTGDLPGTNRLEIDCERGRLVCEDGRIRLSLLKESERDICFRSEDPWYRETAEERWLQPDGDNPQHCGVINAFAAHLLRGEPLTASARDGLRALQLSNAIHYSSWTGSMTDIPADGQAFSAALRKKAASSRLGKKRDITYDSDHSGTGARRQEASAGEIVHHDTGGNGGVE